MALIWVVVLNLKQLINGRSSLSTGLPIITTLKNKICLVSYINKTGVFDSEKFSKDLKIQVLKYKEREEVDVQLIDDHIDQLKQVELFSVKGDSHKKAFWINVYNGITNYWIIKKKIKKSMREVPGIFLLSKLKIGDNKFSLDDIEHGILRKNAKRLKLNFLRQFSTNDSKKQLMVDELDYRIHFALNCGATSCPPVAFYSSERINEQLAIAEESFSEQEFIVDKENKTINYSQIFSWYKEDFESVYLNNPQYSGYKLIKRDYNWNI